MARELSNPHSSAADDAQLLPSAASAISRIREVLSKARHQALAAVNSAMVQAYWEVGREIVEEEQRGKGRAGYGHNLIENLSLQLTEEFGKGFTATNLRYMRQFYQAFPIHHALRDELSWSHYRLLSRIDRPEARAFYETECVAARWSTRELERQIGSLLFDRLALSTSGAAVRQAAQAGSETFGPQQLLRDPYVLEFTGLQERTDYLESDLEAALMDKLQQFLLELGRDFFFVARQKRITVDGDHFYVDLVFYHRELRCFVLIDLKVGQLTHGDIGQMLFYTGYFEQQETREGENPPIGLILCTDKNESVVRYTLSGRAERVFASKYQLHLPSEEELKRELERERDQILASTQESPKLADDDSKSPI